MFHLSRGPCQTKQNTGLHADQSLRYWPLRCYCYIGRVLRVTTVSLLLRMPIGVEADRIMHSAQNARLRKKSSDTRRLKNRSAQKMCANNNIYTVIH